MEFRQIRYATTVAREGSFTRAAEKLNVSQSAISEQVKLLEGRIGFPLLERTGRGVRMTDRGQVFLHEAERVSNDLMYLLDVARYLRDKSAEKMVIGIISGLAPAIVPTLFPSGKMPKNALIEVQTAPTRVIFDYLYNGTVDVGIAIAVDPDLVPSGLTVRPLCEQDLVLAIHPNHELAKESGPLNVSLLEDEPLIMSDLSVGYGVTVMNMLGEKGVRPSIRAVVDNIETTKVMVQTGIGHALLPAAAVENVKNLGLVSVRPIEPSFRIMIETYRPRLGLSKRKEMIYSELVGGFKNASESDGQWVIDR